MRIRFEKGFSFGYTAITELNGNHSNMLMDFGILRIRDGNTVQNEEPKERAYLLLNGAATVVWKDQKVEIERNSLVEELPHVIHLPERESLTITSHAEDTEFSVYKIVNPQLFETKLYTPSEVRVDMLTSGSVSQTTKRTLRTVLDDATARHSNMSIGELINFPGIWSSYPPHYHAQPEIYHYRFFPHNGFGYSEQGDDVYKVRNGDTVAIPPNVTHPQVAAPGYTMFYLWAIPHVEGERFNAYSRIFDPEHTWILE
jgi:5-deoxy-glucuronate isomerase